jgi:sentrin-specific protease 1
MKRANEEPEKYPKIHIFSTFFYTTLKDKGYIGVRRWTRKVMTRFLFTQFDIFSKDLVVFPVHLGVHWVCGVINFKLKRLEYYDSLHGKNKEFFQVLFSIL